jgi:hypothetical protein
LAVTTLLGVDPGVLAPEIRPRGTENPLSAAVREQYRIRIYRLGSAITPGPRLCTGMGGGRLPNALSLFGRSPDVCMVCSCNSDTELHVKGTRPGEFRSLRLIVGSTFSSAALLTLKLQLRLEAAPPPPLLAHEMVALERYPPYSDLQLCTEGDTV